MHQMETFMGKALRDEAVARLPRVSNNAVHGGLRLARRVKSFQAVHPFFNVTHGIAARCVSMHVEAPILFLLRHLLERFHAMFGLASCPGGSPGRGPRCLFSEPGLYPAHETSERSYPKDGDTGEQQ